MDTAKTRAPWHFWAISGVSLLWNAFGGYDYTMTQTHNMGYLTQAMGSVDAAQKVLDAVDAFPVWATAAWAFGVWGSLLGSVMLLLRSRHAVTSFVVSLAGAIISFAYQFAIGVPEAIKTPAGMAMTAMIFSGVVFFWWYSRRCTARGILR